MSSVLPLLHCCLVSKLGNLSFHKHISTYTQRLCLKVSLSEALAGSFKVLHATVPKCFRTAGAYIGLMKPNEASSGWCWLGNCSLSVDSLLGTPLRIESCVSLSSVRPYTNPCTNANEYICETQKGSFVLFLQHTVQGTTCGNVSDCTF